jgi:cytochrome c oxidase cbb3-type subunit III
MVRWLCISAFSAINFCWWSGEPPVVYAQKTKSATATPSSKADSAVGRKVFAATCAGCHGLDGRGGEKGPNIATRPEISRRSNDDLLAILKHGVPAAGMPAFSSLGDAQLQAVVRHLRTLQGLNAKTEVAGDAEEGRKLFFKEGSCASCHMINGAGGFLSSDLSSYGATRAVAEIREQIMNHDQSPRARPIVISTRDGRSLLGFARNEDNFSLQFQTLDGTFHFLDKSIVANVDYTPPANEESAEKKLTKSDVDALISYFVHAAQRPQDGIKRKMLRRHQEDEE